jgi:fatty-acyl-CoA synthase
MSGFSFDWTETHARSNPDALALIDLPSGREFSYGQLAKRVGALSAVLAKRFRIGPGDRVAVSAGNRADFFTLQFACWRIGAIFAPTNWRLSLGELKSVLAIAEPSLFLCDEPLELDQAGMQQVHMPDLQLGIDRLMEGDEQPGPHFVSEDDQRVLTLVFTSGTTGKPKAVPYTERMVTCCALHAAAHSMVDADTRTLLVAPLFHSAGLFAMTTTAFHFGGMVAVDNVWEPERCLAMLADKGLGISHFNGVPTIFNQLTELPQFAAADLSHVKLLGIGSAPISRELLACWQSKGVLLAQSYGSTEAFGVSVTPAREAAHFLGSAGTPMMHSQVRIVLDGENVPLGDVGEVWVQGPSVMPGYWRDAGGRKGEVFADGWLKTGDLGRMDERGTLFIVGRLKDMIISGGENIYPAEIEHALTRQPAIRAVAIVGAPHEKWGETPVAVIEFHPGESWDLQELREFCKANLAGYKVPTHWFEAEMLPHNAQGKVAKPELQAAVLAMLSSKQSQGGLRLISSAEKIA